MTSCPGAETIETFVTGRSSPSLRHEVEVHLDGCRACSRLVVQLLKSPHRPGGARTAG
jgi:hypothetical protein